MNLAIHKFTKLGGWLKIVNTCLHWLKKYCLLWDCEKSEVIMEHLGQCFLKCVCTCVSLCVYTPSLSHIKGRVLRACGRSAWGGKGRRNPTLCWFSGEPLGDNGATYWVGSSFEGRGNKESWLSFIYFKTAYLDYQNKKSTALPMHNMEFIMLSSSLLSPLILCLWTLDCRAEISIIELLFCTIWHLLRIILYLFRF